MFLNKPRFWNNKNLSFLAIIFYPLSLLVIFIVKLKKLKKKKKFKIPIICVGNIYLGGTGKTPLSIKINQLLITLGKKPAIVKKFYPYLSDEISMIKKYGKLYTSKNRSKLINELIKDDNDIAILDDGFQDNSIFKDLSILCFNKNQMIGNGLVIPSGPLREPLSSIQEAQLIFINGDKNLEYEKKFLSINPFINFYYFKYIVLNKDIYLNDKYIAFAGIGNPDNFFNTLKNNEINLVKTFIFNDHHKFKESEMNKLLYEAKKCSAKLITTEKDYHRLNEEYKKKVQYVKINIEIKNEEIFINYLKNII